MNQEIQRVVRNEVRQQYSAKQFGQSPLPKHIHNGIDAPPVFNPTRVYAGNVPFEADINTSVFFPVGWTMSLQNADQTYRITHNLNTDFYTVTACQSGNSAQRVVPSVFAFPNYFEITWIDSTLTGKKQEFNFILTLINNRATQFPNYKTNL